MRGRSPETQLLNRQLLNGYLLNRLIAGVLLALGGCGPPAPVADAMDDIASQLGTDRGEARFTGLYHAGDITCGQINGRRFISVETASGPVSGLVEREGPDVLRRAARVTYDRCMREGEPV